MKLRDVIGIIIGILVLLTLPAILLITRLNGGEPVVERNVEVQREVGIPAIDAFRPAETEIATFALG